MCTWKLLREPSSSGSQPSVSSPHSPQMPSKHNMCSLKRHSKLLLPEMTTDMSLPTALLPTITQPPRTSLGPSFLTAALRGSLHRQTAFTQHMLSGATCRRPCSCEGHQRHRPSSTVDSLCDSDAA